MLCDYACMQSKRGGGVSKIKLPSDGYRAIGGGIAAMVLRYRAMAHHWVWVFLDVACEPKWLFGSAQSDTKMTKRTEGHSESLKNDWNVTFGILWVTFKSLVLSLWGRLEESLLSHFFITLKFFWISGLQARVPYHNLSLVGLSTPKKKYLPSRPLAPPAPSSLLETPLLGFSIKTEPQGNTPWVAPACADCPGFRVLGSAPAPAATLVSEPQIVPLG